MKVLLTISILIFACSINAQDVASNPERPKIGLVLSGGGAKGLAHIGVIKVLEEAGIRPDYIAGTSMGSIIGGLYASGYTAAEMDSIVRNMDWTAVLSDQISLSDVVPVEKGDYHRFQLEFDITKKGLNIPSGVVKGQGISEAMSELTWHVSHIEDFDDLPIPFRCVAADLITGKAHVFEGGDLMLAMRASMAIPSVFTPVEVDTMYLVDGGVLDNFPVKVALDMGADIIIGVNVGLKDYPKIEDLNSLPKVLLNAAMIASNNTFQESVELSDYIVSPDLDPYTASSFLDGLPIIERGEVAARKQFDQFKRLADSINAIGPPEMKYPPFVKSEIIVSEIDIRNRKNISLRFFYNNLGFEAGDTITAQDINEGMNRLLGTRFYDKITYEINKIDGQYRLIFYTQESKSAKAKFSIRYDNELKAGIVANMTIRNLLVKNSRLSLTGDISEDPRFSGTFLGYIGEKQKIGLLSDLYFEHTPMPIYKEGSKKYGVFDYNKNQASVGAFFTIKRRSMLSVKLNWQEILLSQRSGIPELFDYEIDRFGNGFYRAQLDYDFNTLNKRYFATRGSRFKLTLNGNIDSYKRYRGAESSKFLVDPYIEVPHQYYLSGLAIWQKYFPVSKSFDIKGDLSIGGFSHDAPFLDMFFVGGTMYNNGNKGISFAGLNYREKIVENFGMARIDFNYNISKVFYGHVILNTLYSVDLGDRRFDSIPTVINAEEFIIGASAGIAINSIIGPIIFGVGTNANDFKLRTYLSLGYPFH